MTKKYRFKFTLSEVLTARVRINNDLKTLPHLDIFKHELSETELDRLFDASDEDYTDVMQHICSDQYITKIRAMLRYEKHKYSVNETVPLRLKRSSISIMKNIIFKEKLTKDDRADIIDLAL